MGKVESIFKFICIFIGILSSVMGIECFYANLLLAQKANTDLLMAYSFMVLSSFYTIFSLLLVWGTLKKNGNCLIPWIVFIPAGCISYAQFCTSLINSKTGILIGLVLCIFNWTIVLQLFLSYKNWLPLDAKEDGENNEAQTSV